MLTVADDACISVLNDAEERRPAHEIIEIESQIVVLRESVQVSLVQREHVHRRHAPDVAHFVGLEDLLRFGSLLKDSRRMHQSQIIIIFKCQRAIKRTRVLPADSIDIKNKELLSEGKRRGRRSICAQTALNLFDAFVGRRNRTASLS